jgi:hypothetical protein
MGGENRNDCVILGCEFIEVARLSKETFRTKALPGPRRPEAHGISNKCFQRA